MTQEIFVQVRFREQTEYGEFNDSFYFTQAEFPSVTPKMINDLIQDRVSRWRDSILNAPAPVPLTREQLNEVIGQHEEKRLGYLNERIRRFGS